MLQKNPEADAVLCSEETFLLPYFETKFSEAAFFDNI
jgi:hypothetical protein